MLVECSIFPTNLEIVFSTAVTAGYSTMRRIRSRRIRAIVLLCQRTVIAHWLYTIALKQFGHLNSEHKLIPYLQIVCSTKIASCFPSLRSPLRPHCRLWFRFRYPNRQMLIIVTFFSRFQFFRES